ncbi:MAG TPA: branched-chain amino acid ABC transporter permease [Anaeromyxobacter sp.]|nr:branched-chain amino acid ABC transporter permease [Anaeromyxobacter sp.]
MNRRLALIYGIAAAALAVVPLLAGLSPDGRYWVEVLNNVGLYALLALSLNVILGDAGLFNMGHAAFYAVGAYTAAIFNTRLGVPILWTLPLSGAVAALFAVLVARPVVHLRGDYLLIVTIGMGEIVRIALVNNVFGLTGGANGIIGIARPSLFGHRIRRSEEFFYLIWGFVALTVFLFHRLARSRFGRALNYLREDEIAAEGSGVPTARHRLKVFALGAAWAGMTGTLFAAKMTSISPESFGVGESVQLFAMVILGGSGSIPGVVAGAAMLTGLSEVFRGFASARMLVVGAAMVLMMAVRPQGLFPVHLPRFRAADLPSPGPGAPEREALP